MKIDVGSQDFSSPKNLWNEVHEYFTNNQVVFVDRYVPYILASVACHVANLRNKRYNERGHQFYGELGNTPDLRFHLLTIAPPGFSKTFFQKNFLNPYDGIAKDIPNVEIGGLTEAGLVGSFDEGGKKVPGLAEEHKDSIIWSDEFAGQTKTMHLDHSATMDIAFLKLLDDGKIEKRLRAGAIEYQSFITLQAGTQNERLDLASGMARRLFVVDAMPDEDEVMIYRDAHRKGRGIKQDWDKISHLRQQFNYFFENFNIEGKIVWDESYDNLVYGPMSKMTHTEVILFNKFAIGYNIMTNYNYGDEDLVIKSSPEFEKYFRQAYVWRNIILGESSNVQILKLVRGKDWPLAELKGRLQSLGMHFTDSMTRINELCRRGVLETYKRGQENALEPGKPALWVKKGAGWFDFWDGMSKELERQYKSGEKSEGLN